MNTGSPIGHQNGQHHACPPNTPWDDIPWFGNGYAKKKLSWPDDLPLRSIKLPKHDKRSLAYLYQGKQDTHPALCFSGSIFSAGGIHPVRDLHQTKQELNDSILRLPPETILCPSLGPITSVGLELKNNPFVAR